VLYLAIIGRMWFIGVPLSWHIILPEVIVFAGIDLVVWSSAGKGYSEKHEN